MLMRKLISYIKNLLCKKVEIDRNYHHYIITDHCRKRMAERKIHYKDINACFKYGKYNDFVSQFVLDIADIPELFYQVTPKQNVKHLLNLLPLVIVIKPGTMFITTVFRGNQNLRSKEDWDLYNEMLKKSK